MSHQTDPKSKTLVVIEDNDLNLKLVSALLTAGGYRFFTAGDAEQGIQLVKTHLPDLVLMDIQLPGMDGLTATRAIKDDPQICHIPVVALSAHAMTSDRRQAESNGVVGYITKPFSTRTFVDKIEGFLPSDTAEAESSSAAPITRKRVLVVDDDPLNLKLIRAKLASEAYEVKCLSSGKEAVAAVAGFLPDIVLLDVIMPDLNGFEVVRQMKSDPQTRNIPVVLITQLDSPEDKSKGLEAGADDFLNKPLNTEELKARVRSLLRMKRYKEQLDGRDASARQVFAVADEVIPSEDGYKAPSVLIAEDNVRDVKLLEHHLQEQACRVIHADTGESALQKVHVEKPDIVLLDLVLPDLDGWTICRKIKDDERVRNTQVVIVTSLKDLDSRIRGIEAGTDDYLLKPIQPEELRARINALQKKKIYLDSLVDKMTMAVKSSITDSLTGLYAHGYLKHFLVQEIVRAQRYHHVLGFVMIDVDDFKRYNDTHGHLAGDAALMDLACIFKQTIRATDLPARYGGEEFAIVLPYTDGKGAMDVAGRIKRAIERHNASREKNTPALPSVSMGISVFPINGIRDAEDLIQHADEALYLAKREGKNCCRSASGCGDAGPLIRAVR